MRTLAAFLLSTAFLSAALAQSPPRADEPRGELKITKLPPASYPAMAMAARVSGPVELSITLRPDGTIDSAEVLSGPAMLRPAAVENARQMQFECSGCAAGTTQFLLSFSYELVGGYSCDAPDKSYPRVSDANGTVTFTGQPPSSCDPSTSVSWIRVRAAKCLYLWTCGRRIVTP
jgi:TonB family protein